MTGRSMTSDRSCLPRLSYAGPPASCWSPARLDTGRETNRAEHEAIAWALIHGPESVFVTADKRASLTALAELGRGRVCHPFDLWLEL